MAAVKAFVVDELKLWFWSNDHTPPHFHAKRSGEWEVKVNFLLDGPDMIEFKWCKKKPTQKVLKELRKLGKGHREKLLKEWEEVQKGQG